MSDYPDPEEEYELMYADELELMRENEDPNEANPIRKPLPAKRSLDFSSPANNTVLAKKPTPIQGPETNISHDTLSQSLQPLEDDFSQNSSNKRTVQDLFGDINDIDFNDVELSSKRQKTEEENDLELIEKIIEGRKLRQMLAEPSRRVHNVKPLFEAKDNISLDIPRWPFIAVTNSDGDRMYVRLEGEDDWESSMDQAAQQTLHASYADAWVEARKILETKVQHKEQQLSQPLPDVDAVTEISSNLWVDKYRPHCYLDLLSEEPVNRALLHWLHLWDKVVFNKEVKTKEPQLQNKFMKKTGQFQLRNHWKGKKEDEPEMDDDGRPHHKVALLCGPPGVGKTTLAHLLARLAGYRAVEVNASDERSADSFRGALLAATRMRSVLDAEKRPNCLILDEIDGAPLPTVELLVKWCTMGTSEGKAGKKSKAQPLKRPVVAICNDLYATSLRPLRPVALVLQVGGVSVPRLALRLGRVAECEGIKLAGPAASCLASRAAGDVRAAIQVLSFMKARAHKQLTLKDVQNLSIGTKDCHKTMMQALTAVFHVNDKDPAAVSRTIHAAGEYDRLADGIFENYILTRVDSRLAVACGVLSALVVLDSVQAWTLRLQNYSLYSLLPMCLMECHRLLATRNSQRVKFPMQAQEMYRRTGELRSIVSCVCAGSAPAVSCSRGALLLDVIPMLPYLLSPNMKSANVQLCSPLERSSLAACVGCMCEYGLQYSQQRGLDGQFATVLQPDIYKVAFFGNEDRLKPSPAVRQAIAREQQLEMIRRNEEMMNRTTNKERNNTTKSTSTPIEKKEVEKPKEVQLPNHLQRLQPKVLTKSIPQVQKDFFGRVVEITQSQRERVAVPDVISASNVFYQYREGFNNAVRRNVRTKDLL